MVDTASIWNIFDELQKENAPVEEIKFIDIHKCKNCNSCGHIVEEVCTKCGYTSNIWIDGTAEWRSGVSEDGVVHDPSRVGMAENPLYSSNWGKGTMMNVKRGQGKYTLTARINYHSGMNHKDRALHKAYGDFDHAALKLRVSKQIAMMAKALYKKFTEDTLTRGAVRTGVKANCLFWACKTQGVPRSTKEVAEAFSIETKDISRTFDKARDIINPRQNKITMPADMVPRIFNNLGVELDRAMGVKKMQCVKDCNALIDCSKLMGKTPMAVAAVVVMHKLALTKAEIARAANVSVATITKVDAIVKVWNDN